MGSYQLQENQPRWLNSVLMLSKVTMRKLPLPNSHALYVTSMLALVALGVEIVFLLIYSSLQCKIQHGMESLYRMVSGSYITRLVS